MPPPRLRSRSGLSLLEVVVSLAILATALAALVGNVFTLNQAHRGNQEVDRVTHAVQLLVERLQGQNWSTIGSSDAPWTWLRLGPLVPASPTPEDPNAVVDPTPEDATDPIPGWILQPMTETAADPEHNLLSDEVGLLAEPSGVRDLRIWVEYRRMASLEGVAAMNTWIEELRDPANLVDVTDPADFDPADFDDALLIRVVARWRATTGGDRHYEISFARRR